MPDYLVQLAERGGKSRRWGGTVSASSPQAGIEALLEREFGPGAQLEAGRVKVRARRCPTELRVVESYATGPITIDVFEQTRLL